MERSGGGALEAALVVRRPAARFDPLNYDKGVTITRRRLRAHGEGAACLSEAPSALIGMVRGGMLFGWYIVGYLFLAGVAAARFWWRPPAACWTRSAAPKKARVRPRRAQAGFYVAPCCMTLAAFLLLLDLGNAERALAVAATPFQSVMSAGAWLVAPAHAGVGCAGGDDARAAPGAPVGRLAVLRRGRCVRGRGHDVHGALLSDMVSIDFWRSPWLVVLFVASSLVHGRGGRVGAQRRAASGFARDRVWAVARGGRARRGGGGGARGVRDRAERLHRGCRAVVAALLVGGRLAPAFWGLVCAAGLALPLACHGAQGASARPAAWPSRRRGAVRRAGASLLHCGGGAVHAVRAGGAAVRRRRTMRRNVGKRDDQYRNRADHH